MRLATAVRPAYGGKIWPDCPSSPDFSFPCFDRLSTGLQYFAQSMHVLSVATQVNLPFSVRDSCWAVASEQHGVRTLAPHT